MIRMRINGIGDYEKFRLDYIHLLLKTGALRLNPVEALRSLHPEDSDLDNCALQKTRLGIIVPSDRNILTEEDLRACPALHAFLYPKTGDGTVVLSRDALLRLLAGPKERSACLGGRPEKMLRGELQELIEELDKQDCELGLKTIGSTKVEPCKTKLCQSLLQYDKIKEAAYWLMEKLNVRACPYCNRQYTTVSFTGGVRPAFDHYYPKSRAPFLALNLFNLIPACEYCNRKKGETWTEQELIYPYDEGFDAEKESVSFHVVAESVELEALFPFILRGERDGFAIELRLEGTNARDVKTPLEERFPNDSKVSEHGRRVGKTVEVLRLEEIYQTHKPELRELMENYHWYNDLAIRAQLHLVMEPDTPESVFSALVARERDRLFFANLDWEDWGKAPLNKLKADILEQLDSYTQEGKNA